MIVQYVGAVLVLIGFYLSNTGKLDRTSFVYQLVNFFGSLALVISARHYNQWGFLLLNAAWVLVAFYGLARIMVRKQ